MLVSSGWLPTISSSSFARTCTSLRCSPPHVQANVEYKGNSIPKSTKRFQQDDQGHQRSYPLGPLLITGTCLLTMLDIRTKGIKSQRQSLSRPCLVHLLNARQVITQRWTLKFMSCIYSTYSVCWLQSTWWPNATRLPRKCTADPINTLIIDISLTFIGFSGAYGIWKTGHLNFKQYTPDIVWMVV